MTKSTVLFNINTIPAPLCHLYDNNNLIRRRKVSDNGL